MELIDKLNNLKIHMINDQYLKYYFRSIAKGQILICPYSILFSMGNVGTCVGVLVWYVWVHLCNCICLSNFSLTKPFFWR